MSGLEDLMVSIRRMGREDSEPGPDKPVDLLLYAPCPVKLSVRDAVESIAQEHADENGPLRVHIPMGCTSIDPYDPVYQERDPDRLPGVIASIGFGDFWRKEFVDRHVSAGVFQAVLPDKVNPLYEQAGLLDPAGCYTVYGVTPYILVVDEKSLSGLPLPRAWEDLLHPRYQGKIVMCGDGDDMADAVLLNIYKDFGPEGIRALAKNTKGLAHSSTLAKLAGGSDAAAGAISIMPVFFALSTKHPPHVRVIWPKDGAAASPLYFLARKKERARLAPLITFFTQGFPAIESARLFMPLGDTGPSLFPSEARIKWLGWDFVAAHEVNRLRDEMAALFRQVQKEGA